MAKPWSWLASGCKPNRWTIDAIAAAGFDTGDGEHPTNPYAAPVRHLTCRDSPLSSRAMAEIFEPSDGVSRELCRECLY
jgi:hypothetical protein